MYDLGHPDQQATAAFSGVQIQNLGCSDVARTISDAAIEPSSPHALRRPPNSASASSSKSDRRSKTGSVDTSRGGPRIPVQISRFEQQNEAKTHDVNRIASISPCSCFSGELKARAFRSRRRCSWCSTGRHLPASAEGHRTRREPPRRARITDSRSRPRARSATQPPFRLLQHQRSRSCPETIACRERHRVRGTR